MKIRCVVAVLTLFLLPSSVFALSSKTIAVMHFVNRSGDVEMQWLSKGLSDLLITDLNKSEKVKIVDRKQLQQFLKEVEFSNTGFVESKMALDYGRTVKAEYALFGSYLTKGNLIEIEAHIINIATQEVERVEWVKGDVSDVLTLEKALAKKLLDRLHVPLTKSELNKLNFQVTDSVSASQHFYLGLDFYDQGKYLDALLEFRLAIKQDESYSAPQRYLGYVYENIGKYEQALLVLKRMAAEMPEDDKADDALFYAASIAYLQMKDYPLALSILDVLIEDYPEGNLPHDMLLNIPDSLSYSLKISKHMKIPFVTYMRHYKYNIYSSMGDYKNALREYEIAYLGEENRGKVWYNNAYILLGKFVREAYRRAGVAYNPMYRDGILPLSLNDPTYREDYSTDKRFEDVFSSNGASATKRIYDKKTRQYHLYPDARFLTKFRVARDYYIFTAPEGYYVDSVDVEMVGYQPASKMVSVTINNNEEYVVSKGVFQQKMNLPLPTGTRMFQMLLNFNRQKGKKKTHYIDKWNLKAHLKPMKNIGYVQVEEGVVVNDIVDEKGRKSSFVYNQPCYCELSLPEGKYTLGVTKDNQSIKKTVVVKTGEKIVFASDFTNKVKLFTELRPHWYDFQEVVSDAMVGHFRLNMRMILDHLGRYHIFWRHEGGKKKSGDIIYVTSDDGIKWTKPAILPSSINTTNTEGAFDILQGEDNRFYLAFYSERAGEKAIYVSSSADMKHWKNPIKIAQHAKLNSRLSVNLIQQSNGDFFLYFGQMYNSRLKKVETMMSNSKDFELWSAPEQLDVSFVTVIEDKKGGFIRIAVERKKIEKIEEVLKHANKANRTDNPKNMTGYPINVVTFSTSRDGRDWTESKVIKPSVTNHNLGSRIEDVLVNNDGEIVVFLRRTSRLVFSRSKEGIDWSPSDAILKASYPRDYPGSGATFLQKPDGEYVMVFENMSGVWLAHSRDPFK